MTDQPSTPPRPDPDGIVGHVYVEWSGNHRCYVCNGTYEAHAQKSARLLYAPYPGWKR